MLLGEDTFLPCTPHGIVELLKKTNIDLSGKEVVVVGRSNIVGKPVGQLLLNENATVTYCHSRTENITEHTKKRTSWWWQSAELTSSVQTRSKRALLSLTSALTVWKAESFAETLNLKGKGKASFITPVPGGVGPMTITMLAHNTVKSAKRTLS